MAGPYSISVASAGDRAIAGPLVVAALVMAGDVPRPEIVWPGTGGKLRRQLREFDTLARDEKEAACRWLRSHCVGVSVLVCSVLDINRDGLRTTRAQGFGRALIRSVENARFKDPNFLLRQAGTSIYVAGPDEISRKYAGPARQLVFREKTDRPWTLDAAYGVARTHRDRLMLEMSRDYPEYSFSANYGYTASRHRYALESIGITPHHRVHTRTVRELELK